MPQIYSAAFIGKTRVASAGKSGELRIWDVATSDGQVIYILPAAHFTHISSLAVNADATWLASGAWDCQAKLFSFGTAVTSGVVGSPDSPSRFSLEPVATFSHRDWVWSVAFASNSRLVTGTESGEVRIWNCLFPFECVGLLGWSLLFLLWLLLPPPPNSNLTFFV